MDEVEVHTTQTQLPKEWYSSTFCVVSVLLTLHQSWLEGKEFKYKTNSMALPAPTEKTISKSKDGNRWGGLCGV